MEETLKNLVAECVEKNVAFEGKIGTVYSVQDLFHNVGTRSINTMWKNVKRQITRPA